MFHLSYQFYFKAILLVMKTRYDRYRLILTPMYRYDNEKVMKLKKRRT